MHLLKGTLVASVSVAIAFGVVSCGGEADSPAPPAESSGGTSNTGGAPSTGNVDAGADADAATGSGGASQGGSGGGAGGAVPGLCGNKAVDPGEDCDDGNADNTDGCTSVCRFTCSTDPECTDHEFCNGVELCDTKTHKCTDTRANVPPEGKQCGEINICKNGICDRASQICGDSIVVDAEECDPPDDTKGCGLDCRFICLSDDVTRDCTPADICNGEAQCDDLKHLCKPRTPKPDFTLCGGGTMQCIDGKCSHCGDKKLQANEGEECDTGDRVDGDGCDHNCKFSCVPGDPDRDCHSDDVCYADGTCNTITHRCSPVQPATAGKGCGSGMNCIAGNCVPVKCGDGVLALGVEPCDDGNLSNSDGCTNSCAPSCANAATDCKGVPTCEVATCTANVCSIGPNAAKDNQPCSTGGGSGTCHSGACTTGTCGNGTVESGEQCDLGAGQNVAGSGCEPTCLYSCQSDTDCDDGDSCNGSETCVAGPASASKKCAAGTNLKLEGDVCSASPRRICMKKNGKLGCALSTCGDGYTDLTVEQCDPPNTAGCDMNCRGKTPCTVNGTWGMKVTVDVSWGDLAGTLEPHSGQILQWSMLTLAQVPSKPTEFTASNVKVCGIEIPDFQGADFAGHEWYGLRFANTSIWDLPGMPKFSGTGRVSNLYAGAAIDFDATAILTGVSLKDPSGAWPPDQATLLNGTDGSFPDHDGDGHPGVTLTARTGSLPMTPYYQPPPNDKMLTFRNPLVNLGDGANPATYGRADNIYVGIRALSSESGTLDTCDTASGQANVASIDNHIPGCHTAPCIANGCTSPAMGAECLQSDYTAADTIKPLYVVSNATFSARRLSGATPNCGAVRTALP